MINNVDRTAELDTSDPINDILWSDPNSSSDNYGTSDRGAFSTYGAKTAKDFLAKNGFELMVRAHEIVDYGFEFPLGMDVPVITLFSATDSYRSNKGAVMLISADLHYTFDIFKGLEISQESQYEIRDFSKEINL
jgi:hypothetical protein